MNSVHVEDQSAINSKAKYEWQVMILNKGSDSYVFNWN